MSPWGLTTRQLTLVRGAFAQFPEIREVRIFGSRAMGNFKPGSDVDLALYGDGPLTCTTRVSALLNEELPLPYRFDLIDYSGIENPELRAHIGQFGQRFY